jgi:hypothetical protein
MAALLCVAGAVLGVRYFAQAAPFITPDKSDYFSQETVTISGSGFAPTTRYDIPIIRPDGTIVKSNGTAGWDFVDSLADGSFTYTYQLDGIPGYYEARVYAFPWDGNRSTSPIASTRFHDGNVKVRAAPSGVTFTLTATEYDTTDCSGSGSSSTYYHVDSSNGKTFGVGSTESVKLQAAATSDQGGSFINWTSSSPFTDLGEGIICVPGFTAGGSRDYYANYGGTPTPSPTSTATPTSTNTPAATSTYTPTATSTFTPVPTSTYTPVPTSTFTPVPTSTYTPVPTSTFTPVPTSTYTPTATTTFTPVPPTPTRTSTPQPFTPTPRPTAHGVGGAVLLPPAAIDAHSGGKHGASGDSLAAWAALAVVGGALATGGLYVWSRRHAR